MKINLSVVIPCYNEKQRVRQVLEQLNYGDENAEIIVVDDGSDEETKKVLMEIADKVKVITHERNKGKAEAMKTGVMAAKGVCIAFVDADLRGIRWKHVRELSQPIIDGEFDMSMGIRESDVFYARLFKFADAYGGERAFDREDLVKNIALFDKGGYLIEAAFNNYYLKNRKVTKVFLKGVGQTAKYQKIGLEGLFKSFKMLFQIIKYTGIGGYIYQVSAISKLKYYGDN